MLDYIAEIKLDLNCMKTVQSISAGQHDKGRKLLITITANGEEFDISNATAVLKGVRFDKTNFALECTIENNKVIAILDDSVLSVIGKTVTRIVLIDSERNYSTQMFIIDIDSAFDGDVTTSENYSILNHLIQQVYMLENGAVLIGDGSISLSQLNEEVKGEFSRKINDEDSVIETSHLKNASVTTDKIIMGAVTNPKIAEGAVAAYHIKDNAVPNRTIVDGAVSSEKLAKNAVTEEKILMGAVTNTKLAADSVSVTKIQNGAITSDKLANGAVLTDKLKDASVTTVKINPGAVTNTRLADCAVSKEKLDENLMPLIGKAIYQNGDSVAAGDGANGNSYFNIIANKYSMAETDKSIGGTTIAVSDFNIKTLSDGTKKDYKSIYERVKETMVGNFDYIILEGGWNDMFASVPLGSLTEHYVQNIEDLNVETTIGATEAICKLLIDRYFETPKLFVLGHKKIDWKKETDWLPMQNAYWNGIISALEKWGIPYVDLRYESNLAAWNQSIADTYFYHKVVDGVDQGGDGTHPNYEAYKKFYVPPIEKALLYGVNTHPKSSLISYTLGEILIPEMSYYLGKRSEVVLSFPSKLKTIGNEIYINFISGEMATTVISGNCIGLENFVPTPNSVCEIHAQYNGTHWVCLTSQTEVSI